MTESTTRRSLLRAGAVTAAAGILAAPSIAQGRGRTYVLVHGAWFGGWVWKPVAEGLRRQGHTVYTPSLTGLGDRRHLLRPGINLDTHADDIVNIVLQEDLKDIVLVGWSYSGMVVSDVLAKIPERIGSMVYLDAFVPERGKSQMNYANRNGGQEAVTQLATQGKDFPPLPVTSLGVTDQAVIDYTTARVSAHPVMTLLQASKAFPERPASIPHTYVLAGGYAKYSIEKFGGSTFQPFHDKMRDDRRSTALVLDTSHVMMLTDVPGTTNILANAK
jgi:pimeloyl-ACP methyl ester carboxylesterase